MPAPTHQVTATELNLRSAPDPTKKNRIATLPQGSVVEKLGNAPVPPWWKVTARVAGQALDGFVNSSFLAPIGAAPAGIAATGIEAVHLRANHPAARRNNDGGRAYPISEAGRPSKLAGSPAQRAAGLLAIIDWLDVETGLRWKKIPAATYCNIYAYDVAYLAGVYIPRVWWRGTALVELSQGKPVVAAYDTTVGEMNANALTNWFESYGSQFGWRRSFDLTEVQLAANAGAVAVIVAHNANASAPGHIQIVAPETAAFLATRKGAVVVNPVQSQAGSSNFRYGKLPANWFAASSASSKHGFWING